MTVRPLRSSDVVDCARLVGDAPFFRGYGVEPAAIARGLVAALDEPRAVLVGAVDDVGVRGFAWFVRRGAFDRSGYLRLLAVRGDQQRGGVGRALMEHLEAEFLSPTGIALLVSETNTAAQRFYQRLGYRRVGTLAGYVKSGVSEHLYFKPAASQGSAP